MYLNSFFRKMNLVLLMIISLILPLSAVAADGDFLWWDEPEFEDPNLMVPDDNGGVIVVFVSGGQIRAQRYGPDGSALWGTTGVLVSDAATASRPTVTEDMFGGIVVAFASGADIYAQRLNNSGMKQWNAGSASLVLNGVNPSEDPIITPDGIGGAYIGYERILNHVQNDGNVVDTDGYDEFVMSAGVERFSMVYDGKASFWPTLSPGGVFLAWFSASTLYIHAQHVNAGPQWGDTNPATMWGVIVAEDYTHVSISLNRLYRVMRDGEGGLIVAWSGWEGYPIITGNGQVRAQRLNASGERLWGNSGVPVVDSSTAGGDELTWWQQLVPPEMTTDGSGGVILTWTDLRNTDNHPFDLDIYCQRINSLGNIQWRNNGVWVTFPGDTDGQTPPSSGSEKNPAIVSDGSGGAVIAVQDYYQSNNIFANRIGSDGFTIWNVWPIWDDDGMGSADQESPRVAFNGSGPDPVGVIVAWQESGGSVGDSAQKIEISNDPPANDNIADAEELLLCGSTPCPMSGSIYFATNDGDSSCSYNPNQPDVWYQYTANEDGLLEVNTCGTNDMFGIASGLDTMLSLHSGTPGTPANDLVCNDDDTSGQCAGLDSAVSLALQSGDTVYVRVSRFSDATNGRFKLNWDFNSIFFGDTNGDNDVDGSDLDTLVGEFESPCGVGCDADFNADGAVNSEDLRLLASNYGKIKNP